MTDASSLATPTGEVIHDPHRKRMILAAVSVALMAVIASMSGLNVAQQQLALDFGASQSTILWIINAYTLALASLLMPIGAIGDRWGRKTVLVSGLAVFGIASFAGAFAGSATMMIGSRIVAGIGAAMIMPVTLSVITTSFPEEERGQAIGIWSGIAGGGAMVGMFVSAAMVDMVTWRWLFVLPIALVAVGLVLTVRFIPNSAEDHEHPFDLAGSILSLLAIGGLVLGIQEGPERGWTHALSFGSLTVGLIAAAAFIAWELRHPAPLLDIRTFADRRLAAGSATLLTLFAVMSGIFLVLFPFFQAVLGWSALHSASAMLPMAAVMMPTSALVPKLSAKLGTKPTLLTGMAIAAAGLATLAVSASVDGGYLSVLPGLLIIGLGTGLAMTPSTEAITSALPADKQGVASALNDTTREVGGAVGVALLGSILSSGYRNSIQPDLGGFPAEIARVAQEGIGAAFGVAPQAGAQAPELIHTAQVAFVEGWTRSMWFGVVMIGVAFVFVALRGPRTKALPAALDHIDYSGPVDDDSVSAVPANIS
ncbi:MAG: MFS transporter [Microthrixaceae bacterium]